MGTNITGIGNANAIGFKSRVTGGIYFPPELKDALVGVWSAYGKSNDSTDRNIIKNKIKDRGGDFVISNAAFKLNSGFGGFVEDFTSWDRIDSSTAEISNDGSKIKCINTTLNVQYLFNYINRDISSFKVKISNFTKGDITYYYRKEDGIEAFFKITPLSVVNSDKVIELPKSYNTVENGTGSRGGFYSSNINIGVTIEQIPSFEGAFVTDGINDLITSTKTVQEMLGGSNEITVVSMIHHIYGTSNSPSFNYTNYIREDVKSLRTTVKSIGESGIYGYTYKNSSAVVINNILGDKNDYSVNISGTPISSESKFSVQGYIDNTNNPTETSQVAWYWTFIAKRVLTTDEINQVIAYFNLDRTLNPDILCNVKKQGITNENHAEFGDKLIDFSGNGRDIQLNNLAWKLDSGIGKYETDLSDTRIWTRSKEITSSPFSFSYNGLSEWILFANTELTNSTDIPSFKIQIKGLLEGQELIYRYYDSTGQTNVYSMTKDGEYTLPSDVRTAKPLISNISGFQVVKNDTNSITITQIPSHAGALCFDGVNDFGKVTGLPIYKDYTVVADRELFNAIGCVLSNDNPGAFIFETSSASVFSFGEATTSLTIPTDKQIRYQTKYSYNGQNISIGAVKEGTSNMWLGTIRDNDARFRSAAIYSLMSFPYSMSEFLIERQLKKHKLGTLYPNMVEFRPVIKANANYKITYYQIDSTNTWKSIKVGDYIVIGAKLAFQITFDNDASELKEVVSPQLSGIIVEKRPSNPGYNIYSYITSKSPQKINITIDEYIRYEDIVQPYPVLLRFNDENGNEVSWGDKIKVGSSITRIGSAADSNLLPNIYNIFGLLLNGNQVTSSKVIVEKTMVFKVKSAYIFDNNEPKCILSPRLLRIPNSSYKILGHIPDISGHGNHGKINNSAYAGASGANGYLQNFSGWTKASGVSSTDSVISSSNNLVAANGWIAYVTSGTVVPTFKVEISGIPINGNLRFEGSGQTLVNGVNTIQGLTTTKISGFYISSGYDNDWSNLRIEQVGEYEGAYCLDGVDDFVTIPTVTGGKQVLMKVNWQSDVGAVTLYDQRLNMSDYEFAIYNGTRDLDDNPVMAYQGRNNGQTYIDGILNSNIMASELKAITHNITITNELSLGINNTYPVIGSTRSNTHFAQMSLYDFMLFDEISTDDKIKELNEYVGIEAKVELPPYYWDTYGKTNSDADRDTIQQRGVAVGDYDLTNYNHAYEGMSGYNGYPVVFGANKTWKQMPTRNFTWNIDDNKLHITKLIAGNGLLFSYVKLNGSLLNVKEIPSFKIKVSGLEGNSKFGYRYLATEDATEETLVYLGNGTHELAKSFAPTEALLDLTRNAWVGIFITPMVKGEVVFDCDITIEVLPEYENGLVYDGITDYSKNANIPALDDFTAIIKREWLKKTGLSFNKRK